MIRPSARGLLRFLSFIFFFGLSTIVAILRDGNNSVHSSYQLSGVSDLPVLVHTVAKQTPAPHDTPHSSILQDGQIQAWSNDISKRPETATTIPTTVRTINTPTSANNTHNDAALIHTQDQQPEHLNSRAWLDGERLSNIDEEQDFVWSQILDADQILLRTNPPDILFQRSICHADSAFKKVYPSHYSNNHNATDNTGGTGWDVTNLTLVQEWTFRLIYLGIHSWHHQPAKPEAEYQRNKSQNDGYRRSIFNHTTNTRNYDFECPSAKYIVTFVPSAGLGASIRTSAVDSLFLGIALGRITLFLANVQSSNENNSSATTIPEDLTKPFLLGGCERHDMQCAFLPTTPCTITKEALEHTMIQSIPAHIERTIYTKGKIRVPAFARARYIYLPPKFTPLKYERGLGSMVRHNLHKHIHAIVEQYRDEGPVEKFQVLDEALRRIRENDFNFAGNTTTGIGYNPFRQAAVLYLFRLNRQMERDVDAGVQATLPRNFDPSKSLGFPVRGSDKCSRESSCLTFETYMDLATEMVDAYYKNSTTSMGGGVTVLLTTEDSAIARASKLYHSEDFDIVMNTEDVHQDTGRPSVKRFYSQSRQIMKTTLIAIKLQMHARRTVGNCCSNFYLVIFDLLNSNCGLSEARQCLQEHVNPKYRICCIWDKSCMRSLT
jgi:hypothetical protein